MFSNSKDPSVVIVTKHNIEQIKIEDLKYFKEEIEENIQIEEVFYNTDIKFNDASPPNFIIGLYGNDPFIGTLQPNEKLSNSLIEIHEMLINEINRRETNT